MAKKKLDVVFQAYKLDGMPLTLVVIGALLAVPGTVVERLFGFLPGAGPEFVLGCGVGLVIFGAVVWGWRANLQNRLHLALAGCLQSLVDGAGRAAREGAGFDAALRDTLPRYKELVEEFRRSLGSDGENNKTASEPKTNG